MLLHVTTGYYMLPRGTTCCYTLLEVNNTLVLLKTFNGGALSKNTLFMIVDFILKKNIYKFPIGEFYLQDMIYGWKFEDHFK